MQCNNKIPCILCFRRPPLSIPRLPTSPVNPFSPRIDPIFSPKIDPIFPPRIDLPLYPNLPNCDICYGTKFIRCPKFCLTGNKFCETCQYNINLCNQPS